MIYEHFVAGGWVGFDTRYIEHLGRKLPTLSVGIRVKDTDKINTTTACLIHKNTEILPDLYKAIGHYLGHRGSACDNEQPSAYFQHEQETSTE